MQRTTATGPECQAAWLEAARDAEAALLAAALQNDDACRLVCERLAEEDLAFDSHRRILRAVRDLAARTGAAPDALTVRLALAERGELDERLASYVAHLGDLQVVASQAGYALERVRDLAARRRVRMAGQRLAAAADEDPVSFGRAVADALAVLAGVSGAAIQERRYRWGPASSPPSPGATS